MHLARLQVTRLIHKESFVSIYISSKQSESTIKLNKFTVTLEKILMNKFSKKYQDFLHWNIKLGWEKLEKTYLNKWSNIPCLRIQRVTIMVSYPKIDL